MHKPPVFGLIEPNVTYAERQAVYAVVLDEGRFAAVKGRTHYFLPGGGSLPGETANATLAREVREEVGCPVQIRYSLGEAVQYFHSVSDGCHFEMFASFFVVEFGEILTESPEQELEWLPVAQAKELLFHESHAWAVGQAMR